jgi:hypothetical protein
VQVGSALNNFIKTRTRAEDVTHLSGKISQLLNNLVASWDLRSEEKAEELASTMILFAGWSWKFRRYEIGYFKYEKTLFRYHRGKTTIPHPWQEVGRSLLFLGDYKREYLAALVNILKQRHGEQPATNTPTKKIVNFDYEPVEALALLLKKPDAEPDRYPCIGGSPQLMKLYPFGNDLPVVIRLPELGHYLLGRKLFEWEKTEYPVLDLGSGSPQIYYSMSSIPLPQNLVGPIEVVNDPVAPIAALGSKDGS